MGILNALSTAVTGLSAQSYALENISGNIANSQTVGFKRVDTSFVDLIPDGPALHESAGSVVSYSQLTNTLQGTLRSTGVATNMAINGDGFFAVRANTGSSSSPTFSGQNLFTRRGDFQTDANGYLVNGSGKFLVGTAPGGGGAAPIQIPTAPIPAKATTAITYTANLPTYPSTTNADPAVPGSELIAPALAAGATVSATDEAAFLRSSISGGETSVYNVAGTEAVVQLRWAKTATSATAGGTDTWNLYYLQNDAATGAQPKWAKVGGDVTFTPAGVMTSAGTVNIPALTVNGTAIGSVNLDLGGGKVTQYSDANGVVSGAEARQDGYTTGTLNSVAVSSDGRIIGSYSNGQIATVAQIQVAHFKATDSLKRMDGGTYSQTSDSGAPTYGLDGASLTGGSVEMSNTDISEEFSKMIVTQQAYSANTRVMSTAQKMLEEVINVVR